MTEKSYLAHRRRQALILSAALALSSVPGLARGQISSVKQQLKPKSFKVATHLHMPKQWTVNGFNLSLPALLFDGNGTPLAGKTVTYRVRDPDGNLVNSCVGTTDSHGRAFCSFQVPALGSKPSYTVEGYVAADGVYERATATAELIRQSPGHAGNMTVAGGPQISVGDIEGVVGRLVLLRAHVTSGGAPVTSGRVRFFSNGKSLAAASVNGSGLARIRIRLAQSQIQGFSNSPTTFVWSGPIQAFYEPPTGSTLRPALTIRRAVFGYADDLCRSFRPDGHRCSMTEDKPSQFSPRIGAMTVSQRGYGSGTVTAKPHIQISFAKPPDPPPNPDCHDGGSGVPAGFCRRSCERLFYTEWSPIGRLLQTFYDNSRSPQDQVCPWTLSTDVNLTDEARRLAHDQCADEAKKRGLSQWGHTITAGLPHRIAAMFRFRDPHTEKITNGWRANLRLEIVGRETTLEVPVRVNCRP